MSDQVSAFSVFLPASPAPPRIDPTIPRPAPSRINGVKLVGEFARVITSFDESTDYMNSAKSCADFVKRSIFPPPLAGPATPAPQRPEVVPAIPLVDGADPGAPVVPSSEQPPAPPTVDPLVKETSLYARAAVFGFMDEVSLFATRAKSSGFAPPDNPFVEIIRVNAQKLQLSEQSANDIIFNIQAYVDLIQAANAGGINFELGTFNAAQLQHINLSYSGLGGTGDPVLDLMRLLPDADAVKAEKAREALSVLDFSKRVPRIVFTAEYSPNQDDDSLGVIIGWRKIPDAAGYIINRHSVIANEDAEFVITTQDAIRTTNDLSDYVNSYVLSFYDVLKPEQMFVFLDQTTKPDDYYIYRMKAWQEQKSSSDSIIPSSFIAMNLTPVQKSAISERIKQMDPNDIEQLGEETISPWPIFAEQLLGDASLDWIFSAVNIRAAVDRNDAKTISRQFSYINAHMKQLFQHADAGRFVRPRDLGDIRNAVDASLSTYGVAQTIRALLQETGILYYFDARDAREDAYFDRAGSLDDITSGIIGVVVGSMDPESATMNLRLLASNLSSLLGNSGILDVGTALSSPETVKPIRIIVNDPNATTSSSAESGIQFLAKFDNEGDVVVDLTTFEGISKMMRVIRIMSDFGPNRIQPAKPKVVVPPPPPTPSTRNRPSANSIVGTDQVLEDKIEEAYEKGNNNLAVKLERVLESKKTSRNIAIGE